MNEQNNSELVFDYSFIFENGIEKKFTIRIDKSNLRIIRNTTDNLPTWTELENFKCPHCPLNPVEHKYCPVAINLADIIEEFKEFPSYQEAYVKVSAQDRCYSKRTSLQAGVSSLIGIKMATSGCPIMSRLKSMVNFHLPFATLEETQIRVLSFYLLYQYVKWKKGQKADWEMTELIKIYEDIRILNKNVSEKIADLELKDTSINSLVILNNFAEYVSFTLDEKLIDEIEPFLKDFDSY